MNNMKSLILGLLTLSVGLFPMRSEAAIDMFLKLGDIKGESTDKTHGGEINLLAWSWGMSQSGTTHMGGGGGAGKVNVQDISLTKYVDRSSTALMVNLAKGSEIDSAVLTFRYAGEGAVEFLKIELKKVIVTSLSTGGSGGEDRFTENITLNFAEVKVTYTSKNAKGGGGSKPDVSTFTLNLAENTP